MTSAARKETMRLRRLPPARRLRSASMLSGRSETSFTVHIRAILCNRLLLVASAMSSITMPSE